MYVNNINTSQKFKSKGYLSVEKNIIKHRKLKTTAQIKTKLTDFLWLATIRKTIFG